MIKMKVTKSQIYLQPQNSFEHEKCVHIPGANYDRSKKAYGYSLSSLRTILKIIYNLESDEQIKNLVDKGKVPEKLYNFLLKIENDDNEILKIKKKGPFASKEDWGFLFKHQQLCREIANVYNRYAFYAEAGTGKTPMALQIIQDDINKHEKKRRWLVICPLPLIKVAWQYDCNRFFPGLKIINLHGGTAAQSLKAFRENADIYIINYESFRVRYDSILKLQIDGVIVDESSKMKNNSSQISKALIKFSIAVEKWYAMSGTPAPNSMLEYFPQMKAIDPTILGSNMSNFKAIWFYPISMGGFEKFEVRPDKKMELIRQIEKRAIFIAKKDCLDLPDKLLVIRSVEMPADLKKMYKQMKRDLYSYIEKEKLVVTATTGVTALGKLNQLTSGILIDDDGTPRRVSNAKVAALMEILEELPTDASVIIWCHFREEFRMIKEQFGDGCVTYYGETNSKEIIPLVEKHYGTGSFDKFRKEGYSVKDLAGKLFADNKVKYLLASASSISHGLTFTNCNYAIYFCQTYSYENWAQSQDRIHRYSQVKKCTYISLLMDKSIDQVIYDCLTKKGNLSNEVLNHLKAEAISF